MKSIIKYLLVFIILAVGANYSYAHINQDYSQSQSINPDYTYLSAVQNTHSFFIKSKSSCTNKNFKIEATNIEEEEEEEKELISFKKCIASTYFIATSRALITLYYHTKTLPFQNHFLRLSSSNTLYIILSVFRL